MSSDTAPFSLSFSRVGRRFFPTNLRILLLVLIIGIALYAPRSGNAAVTPGTCVSTAGLDVSADPSTLTLTPSTSGTSIVTVTPTNGFTGTVTLVLTNIDTGLTPSLGSVTLDLSAGPRTSTVTVTTSSTITSGSYHFDVNATTTTTLFEYRTITVHVPKPELGITPTDYFLTIPKGSPGTDTINLKSLHGLPTSSVSLSATVSPSTGTPPVPSVATPVTLTAGGSAISTLSVPTTGSTTPGFYTITVTGTASPGSVTNSTYVFVLVTAPGFGLSVKPSSLVIPAGSSNSATINVTSIEGFSGSVSLAAVVLPPIPFAPTASFAPASVTLSAGSHSTSTLTIDTTASTVPMSYSVSVTGTSGSTVNATFLMVTVPGPGFLLSASPDVLTVATGIHSATSTITLTSLRGFTDTVDLSLLCFPDGLTGSVSPASVPLTGATATATLLVSTYAFTVPGNYTVDVSGFGSTSFAYNSTTVTVRVTGPDFTLDATPMFVSLTTGGSTTSTITATSKLSFSRAITLAATVYSLSGSTTGFTATLSTASLTPSPGGSASATITLASSTAGTYEVLITGTSWPLVHETGVSVLVSAPTPDFSLTATPPSLSIAQGGTRTSSISLTSIAGFAGTVALTATSSAGITPTLSLASISGSATSTLTVSVGGSVPVGSYSVDVKGTSSALTHHAFVTITVTSPSPVPDFSISATTPVSFTSGSTGTSTVTVTGTGGFYSYVTLTSSVTPTGGLSVAISPSITYPGTSTATFSSSTTGDYTVTITGTSGSTVRTATVHVTVTALGSPDFGVTVSPSSLTVQAGNSATSTVTISSSYGFAGTVTLTSSVPAPGPTASLSTSTISGGSGSSIVTITVADTVAAGTYTVTVQATSGNLSHSKQITVTVTAAPQAAAPAANIFGLAPLVFYGAVGAVVAMVAVGGIVLVIRGRKPDETLKQS